MKFIVEKVANMVFVTSDCGTVFNAWDEYEFTERKLNNAMRKIEKIIAVMFLLKESFNKYESEIY